MNGNLSEDIFLIVFLYGKADIYRFLPYFPEHGTVYNSTSLQDEHEDLINRRERAEHSDSVQITETLL